MANTLFDALFAPHIGSNAPFLILPGGEQLSHADFASLSGRLALTLSALGVQKGDRVAVQVAKSPEALAIYAACIRIGAILLPLNTAYTTEEMGYFIGDAEPVLVICDPLYQAGLQPIAAQYGARLFTLGGQGGGSLLDAAAGLSGVAAVEHCAPQDLAAILYTSGTTGRSKGAMITHQNLLSNAQVLADLWQFSADDTLLHALPIFHTHGLFVAVNVCLIAGSAMVFQPSFDAEAVLAALPQATALMGVPTFYTRLLALPGLTHRATAHMRLFVSGSAPLLADTHRQFTQRTGHRILERYGMTETNMNTSNPVDGDRKAGTVGLPLPGTEVSITDPVTGALLATGQIGMVEVRGPNVFAGYWHMPEKTAAELRPNGFFITGDLGQFDGDGYLTIVGRQKDLIISGGYNIYPKEIEALIDEMAGVIESAVIGIRDDDFGEAVLAIVAVSDAGLTGEEILNALRPRLARFKHPCQVILTPDLPRNAMGKVQKAILRATYCGSLRSETGGGGPN